jgi:hypothetical protein
VQKSRRSTQNVLERQVLYYIKETNSAKAVSGEDLSQSTGFPQHSARDVEAIRTIVQQNADHWNATTIDALWARRDEFVEKFNTWQEEILGGKFHEWYVDIREEELLRGVPIQHQLYYLGLGQFDKNFLTRIESEEVSTDKENCFCRFSTKI